MRIFYDVDTQKDFMNKNGALYVPDAELIKPNLELLTKFALKKGFNILGSVDRHFGTKKYMHIEKELKKFGGNFPEHCMDGTKGQQKISETLHGRKLFIPREKAYSCSGDLKIYDQIIFEKQTFNVFYSLENLGGNKNIDNVLKIFNVNEAIVYGVATDYCVKEAAIGLKHKDIDIYVVLDAIKPVACKTEKQALDEMCKKGIKFRTTSDVIHDRIDELKIGVVGYCHPTKFDEKKASELINDAYDKVIKDFPNREKSVVSRLTNVGILKIAYEEASKRKWRTQGIACEKSHDFEFYPVDDKPVFVGKNWGDESQTFTSYIDVLVRIGGGIQSKRESRYAREVGKKTYEYALKKIK